MKLILSTGNIMGGSSPIRRDPSQKSNAELISSLRSNFAAHSTATPNGHVNGGAPADSTEPAPRSYTSWTHMQEDGREELEVPALDFTHSGLQEEREQYDITLKLFHLPGAPVETRAEQARDALNLVLKELHMPSADLLIVSFPGIYFDEEESCPDKLSTRGPVDAAPEPLDTAAAAWRGLEALRDAGLVSRLGVAEFGHDRLSAFLAAARSPPAVDQINLRDCCSVPRDLLRLAKDRSVELLVHNDSANILPRGAVRDLLGADVGVLAGPGSPDGLRGEVQPLWVVKYTAVVRNRGVVENKGYFAAAQLVE